MVEKTRFINTEPEIHQQKAVKAYADLSTQALTAKSLFISNLSVILPVFTVA
jgi:hypothetical protein